VRRLALVLAAAIAVAAGFWSAVVLLLGTVPAPVEAAPGGSDAMHAPIERRIEPQGRVPLAAPPSAQDTEQPDAHPDFDVAVEQLVALGLAIHEALTHGENDAAIEANRQAESLVIQTVTAHRDAGTLALDRMVRHTARSSVADGIRSRVLERLLADDLRARHSRAEAQQAGPPLDPLLDAMLAYVPASRELAEALGRRLLTAQPYLGPAQEPAVLELSEQTSELPFLLEVVPDLLCTLWRNLEANGGARSARLRALALLFLDDPNPSRRQAAAVRLLEDPTHRALAVAATLRSADVDLAAAVGRSAAVGLPAAEALDVLTAVSELGGEALVPAFVALGMRAPQAMVSAYEQALADGDRTTLRRSLLTGATAQLDPGALALAELAFHSDPDPEIRGRALFALAAHPDVHRAERSLHEALDDPRRRSDVALVGQVALALRNLRGPNADEARTRVAERLRLHPALGARDRSALESWLAQVSAGPR